MAGETFSLSVLFRVINQATAPVRAIGRKFEELGKKMSLMGMRMRRVGMDMSMMVTLPLALMGKAAATAAIDYEQGFTGIRKTIKATEPELQKIRKALDAMSLKVPLPITELHKLGEIAGQMGIETPGIVGFVKVMADLAATTQDLKGAEGAKAITRFAAVTRMAEKDFDRLGSAITYLGNNYATTEAEMVSMAIRLAGAGKMVGMTQAEIMGLAAGLRELGLRAQLGGTAFSKVMRFMNKAVVMGGEKLFLFSKISGKTTDEFRKGFKDNAIGAVLSFIEGLVKLGGESTFAIHALEKLGLTSDRVADVLGRAVGGQDVLTNSVKDSTKAWKENIATSIETALRYKTMGSKFTFAATKLFFLRKSFGEIIAPGLLDIFSAIEPGIKWLSSLSKETKTVIIVFGALAATLGPLLLIMGMFSLTLATIGAPLFLAVIAFGALAAMFMMAYIHAEKLMDALRPMYDFFDMLETSLKNVIGLWAKWVGTTVPVPITRDTANNMPKKVASMFDTTLFDMKNAYTARKKLPFIPDMPGMGIPVSKAEITVKVEAAPGTVATISDIKKKGLTKINLISQSFMGPMLPVGGGL